MRELLLHLDRAVFDWTIHHRLAWVNTPIWLLSEAADAAVLWLIIALTLLVARRISGQAFMQVCVAIGASSAISNGLMKPLVNRTRPLAVGAADLIGRLPHSGSFPSGHAANSFAAAFVLSALLPRAAPAFWLLAVLIAISRVYVGVHYPLDIMAGAMVGLVCGALVRTAAKRLGGRGGTSAGAP